MIFFFFFGLYIYCVFPKQAEKFQLEFFFFSPAVIFIFSSGYALLRSPAASLRNGHYFQPGAGLAGGGRGAAGCLLQESGSAPVQSPFKQTKRRWPMQRRDVWRDGASESVGGHGVGPAGLRPFGWWRPCPGKVLAVGFSFCVFPPFSYATKRLPRAWIQQCVQIRNVPLKSLSTLPHHSAKALKQQGVRTLKQRREPVHCTDSGLQNCPRGPRKPLSINENISFNCFAFQKQPNQLRPVFPVFAGGWFCECRSELAWWDRNTFPCWGGSAGVGWSALPPCKASTLACPPCAYHPWGCCRASRFVSCPPEAALEWAERRQLSHSSVTMPLRCDWSPKGDRGVKRKKDSACQIALCGQQIQGYL